MGRYLRGNIDEQLSLGTLAAQAAVLAAFDETVNERTLVSSLVASWSMNNFTQGDGIGLIYFGVAHSDYTAAEIEEWIETVGSWNEGDVVETREVGKRLIRQIGIFEAVPGGGIGTVALREGAPVKTKLNWILNQGQTIDMWAYNTGGNPVGTTVPVMRAQGHANLWPR